MTELETLINDYLRLADFRNLAYENPVRIKLQPDTRTFILVVSYTEPSFSQTPYNVLWLCADREDDYAHKIWRRVDSASDPATPNKKYTWEEIVNVEHMYAVDQYYQFVDESKSWEMGLSWGDISAASTTVMGLVKISATTDGTGIKAIGNNDPRLSDKRTPTEHDHPDFPRTMVHIAGTYEEDPAYADRVNDAEIFVRFSEAQLPTEAGQIFKLTRNNPSRPNEWFGTWFKPTAEDFEGERATLVSASAYVEGGLTTIDDNSQVQIHVDSLYSDSTVISKDAGSWSIAQNTQGITIDPQTGLLSVPDIDAETVVTVYATVVDKNDSSNTAQASLTLRVLDSYTPVLPISVAILGPASVNEKNGTTYELEVTYSNGDKQIKPASSYMTSDVAIATITMDGEFDAKDIDVDTTVTITATYVENGVTLSTTKDVLVIAEVIPVAIVITGPSVMNEMTTINLAAEVTLSNGTTYITDVSDVNWEFLQTAQGIIASPSTQHVSYTSSEEVDGDKIFSVRVSAIIDGVSLEAVHDVTVKDITVPPVPQLLEIMGADSIAEGDIDEPYSFQVTYDNGASVIVQADSGSFTVDNTTDADAEEFQLDSNGNIVLGHLSSISDIAVTTTVTLSAKYTEGDVELTATKDVIIVAAPAKPLSLVISGPDELPEKFKMTLQAYAQMDDGSSRLVSGNSSEHPVTWTFVQSATGVSHKPLEYSEEFESSIDIDSDETFIVEAKTTIQGIVVTAQHTVQLKDVPLVPESLAIQGLTTVNENSTTNYQFVVTWSDSSTTAVTPTSVVTGNPNFALTTNGIATVGEFGEDTVVNLEATYVHGTETLRANLDVTVVDVPVPESLAIQGSALVSEQGEYTYQFVVTWSDSSTTTITPDSVNASHTSTTFGVDGKLVVGDITTDDTTTLTATATVEGVTLSAPNFVVNLTADPVPVSITIIGVDEFDENSEATYSFSVEMSDTTVKTVTPDSFVADSLAVTIDGSTVDSNEVAEDTVVTLTASYNEGGVTVTDDHIVTVKDIVTAQSLTIVGPSEVGEQTTQSYTFNVTWSDGSVTEGVSPYSASSTVFSFGLNGDLVTPRVTEDVVTTLNASYRDSKGNAVYATKDVTVRNSIDDIDRIVVTGDIPDPYYEGDPGIQLTAIMHRESGATEDITNTGIWYLDNAPERGTISNTGFFTPNEVIPGYTDFVAACKYPGNDLKIGKLQITVYKRPVTVRSISINGPVSMNERDTSNLSVTVTFSDDSTSVVTSNITWTVEPGSSGSFTGNTYTAPEVSSNTTHVVRAEYQGIEDTHSINVQNVPKPVSLTISGNTTVDSGDTLQLGATASYEGNTTSDVTTSATWTTSNSATATVNSSGVLTAKNVTVDTQVTITATYEDEGVTVSDTHVVTVNAAAAGEYTPRWGTIGPQASGTEIRSIADFNESFMELLTKPLTGTDGETFTMIGGTDSFDNPNGGFAPYVHNRVFVAYPASLGWAKFVDDVGNAGGFDGATALPDESGTHTDSAGTVNVNTYANNGGIEVTIGGKDYIIYAQYMSSHNADYTMTLTYGGSRRISGEL